MITYLKIYLYSGHTEFWVNQETIINKCVLLKSLAYKADFTSYFMHFFFCQGFLSRTQSTHRTAGEGRRPSFIPLYHYHPLTNIQAFICNFACEMTHIFLIALLVFTRLLLDEICHLIELSFHWLMMWRKFMFVYVVISNTLVLQANRLTQCASHPKRFTLTLVHLSSLSMDFLKPFCNSIVSVKKIIDLYL